MQSLKDGFITHLVSIKSGFKPSIFTHNQLINFYCKHGLLREARRLFDEMPERNVFSWNAIISSYIKSNNLVEARKLFDSASTRDLVTYNTMLTAYVSADGYDTHALDLFIEMRGRQAGVGMDEFTATTMLNLSAKLSALSYGRQLHAFMVKSANNVSGFGVSSLIDMYSKCGCFDEACNVFRRCNGALDSVTKNAMMAACCRNGGMEMAMDLFWSELELNDTVSWNTLIAGYVKHGHDMEVLNIFVMMASNGVGWNEHTFVSVLNACSSLRNMKLGKEVHAWLLKDGLLLNSFISSAIIDFYCKCGNMKYAELVHSENEVINPFSAASMIEGYSSQGNMLEARRVFDSLAEKNAVVWTALLSGYVKAQQCGVVFELLNEFISSEATPPDALMLTSVFGACTLQAALNPGKQVHAYMLRAGIEMDKILASAIIDMYAKSGNINYAEHIFKALRTRDLIIYNVMLGGYAHHGYELEAVKLFEELIEKDIRPDAITFLALLSACRHRGLVELGEKYFNSMKDDYNILPESNHYACMIDLYSRANQLEKAAALMRVIPTELDAATWGAFLHACKINKNSELATVAEEELLKLEGDSGARYVQLANVYATAGKWAEMGRIRKEMRGKDVKKFAGCSWLYIENGLHVFTCSDTFHSETGTIYAVLDWLTGQLYEVAQPQHSEFCV